MATTKTLTPTNQAITLAAFTEKPDNRTNVTNDDKLADAVNTLNSKIRDDSDGSINLNNYITTGMYAFNGRTSTNAPESGISTLIVQRYSNDWISQMVTVLTANGSEVYVRDYHDGTTWSSWEKLALNSKIKTLKITYRPENNIAAGESGLFTVSVPEEVKGKTILAVSFGINHVGQAYGYQLSGTYIPTLNDAYISYYAPRAITAANADFDMTIAYM